MKTKDSAISTSLRSTKTASLRPKGEVPQKYAVAAYKTLGDFSIVPHFEVTSMSWSAFVTRTSLISEHSPSFATKVIEKDVYNVHNTIGLLPENPSIDYSGNALKTQYTYVLPASCAGQAVANEDNKIDQRHFDLMEKSPSLTSKAGLQLEAINKNLK